MVLSQIKNEETQPIEDDQYRRNWETDIWYEEFKQESGFNVHEALKTIFLNTTSIPQLNHLIK